LEFKENGMVLMKENVKLSQEHKSAYNIQHPGNLSTLKHYSPIHYCLTTCFPSHKNPQMLSPPSMANVCKYQICFDSEY